MVADVEITRARSTTKFTLTETMYLKWTWTTDESKALGSSTEKSEDKLQEKYITETETKNRVSTFMPTRLGGHGWRPCVWLCKGQCCRHCHKIYKQKLGFMYSLMVVVERLGHVGISTHCREI
jgi:hypothetical protein